MMIVVIIIEVQVHYKHLKNFFFRYLRDHRRGMDLSLLLYVVSESTCDRLKNKLFKQLFFVDTAVKTIEGNH